MGSPKSDTEQQPASVVGYVRVSSQEQASEGLSLAVQRKRIAAYAVGVGLTLARVHEDAGISAKSVDKRPGLMDALLDLEEGRASGLVVVKLDRLTRTVRDLGRLVDEYFAKRFALFSIVDSVDTRSAGGRLVLNVLGSISQWEREAAGERTRDVLQDLKSRGVKLGPTPMGVRRTGERDEDGRMILAPDEGELAIVRRILELHERGLSNRSVASVLTADGHKTRTGNQRWSAETVRNVIRAHRFRDDTKT